MRSIAIACALLCAVTTAPANAAEDGGAQPLIIGGAPVSSAPWAAAVYRSGSFTCSGTILAPQWVLTAKHCVGAGLSVRVGNVYRAQGTPSSVTRYVSHPQADMSLLQLATPIQTSQYSRLADANPPTGSTNQLYGWGYTSRTGPVSPQLKTADVRLTSICRDYYGGQALCTTRITGNAWSGDSGGPQVYNGLQVGVASTADGTSTQQYSSVPAVRAWIRSTSGV
ncbi:S1 family peptidase [Saccharothrix syringae]|uniref:Trypsin-like serine protease n=1 Tax=Saccharothrix syringae TaxID=103733 RepID=A0A5Q0H1P9_SACSY|nr:trypsin-like serine protease [Saccharothrix syringae]QFZ19720.1 trypsin-like serine protease [Saccharothrix syringae]